jgi:hypothetical protein
VVKPPTKEEEEKGGEREERKECEIDGRNPHFGRREAPSSAFVSEFEV